MNRGFKTLAEAQEAGVYISKVKSFVKREGRLTKAQAKAIDKYWDVMGLDIENGMLGDHLSFDNPAPIVLEIGFGMGKSLVEMARTYPENNYIGIEVHKPGIGACLAEAGEYGLTNLKVYEFDAVEVLDKCIPDRSIHRLQLFFPDPWHKKRHHKRRIVQPDFVAKVKNKLTIGGRFHMATDWEPYAEHMLEVMNNAEGFRNTSEESNYVSRPIYRPITKFEVRGQRLGHGVWDLVFERES